MRVLLISATGHNTSSYNERMSFCTVLIMVRAPPIRLEMVESISLNRSPSPAWAGKGTSRAISRTRLVVLIAN